MKQLGLRLNLSTKKTRKREFLDGMERVVPWSALVQVVERYYPSFRVEPMLRIHYLQLWSALSDPAMEEALHDMPVFREFAKLEDGVMRLPNEMTIPRFRHLLEKHDLATADLATARLRVGNDILQAKGVMMKKGTFVDATLIAAPSSTKNAEGERDPEMKHAKKGNQWYFGMKAHISVDAHSGLVPSVVGTAANVNDVTQAGALLHGDEGVTFGGAGYQGVQKRIEAQGPQWHVAMRPGLRRKFNPFIVPYFDTLSLGKWSARVRAKVEHPFRVFKRQYGYTKVRYRGLAQNTAQVFTLFVLSNMWMARRQMIGSR